MNCDIELHEGLIELGDMVCPFCNNELGSNEKPRHTQGTFPSLTR